METIKEAKDFLNENYKEGCICPCCNQTVKLYKRKLNSGMARVLIAMYKKGGSFFHVKDYLREYNIKNTHDWTLLKYWGLIEPMDNHKGGQELGYWSITEKGKQFCKGELKLQKHVLIITNKMIGFSSEDTDIVESLGNHFDYNELMN